MTNYSASLDPDPQSALWLGIVYTACAAIGIPTNLLVLALTVSKPSVRAYPINICIFSLAFTDMMVLVSFLSSMIWAVTYNVMVCKVMGVGIYVFIVMSMMLPSCLALCRHAGVRDDHELHPVLRALKTRKGILVLNGLFWTYGLFFMLPFIIADKFGLDEIGCCGVVEIDSIFLWVYYLLFMCLILFAAYAVTFTFYRKLSWWVQMMSSLMTLSPQSHETLLLTRSVMRMIRWLLFVPVVFYYPALIVQTSLRIHPHIISLRTARIIMITVPLPHIIDPIVTLLFVKCYRTAFVQLLLGNAHASSLIHPSQDQTSRPSRSERQNVLELGVQRKDRPGEDDFSSNEQRRGSDELTLWDVHGHPEAEMSHPG